MDRPLLFLVVALIAIGVFLFLRRQDEEKATPMGPGVPFDTDAGERLKAVDAKITSLQQQFGHFDTTDMKLSHDAIQGITEILKGIGNARRDLHAMDVDVAENQNRQSISERLEVFTRTIEKVIKHAKVDQARVDVEPAVADGPSGPVYEFSFAAAPNLKERPVELEPGAPQPTKPKFGGGEINLAPNDVVRPEDGLTGRERHPGVQVANVVSEDNLQAFQASERAEALAGITKANVLRLPSAPKPGTQEEQDARAAAKVNQPDPLKPPLAAEIVHAKEPSRAEVDRKEALGSIQFDSVNDPKQLVVPPLGREAEAASTLLQMMRSSPAQDDGSGGVSFDSAPKRDAPETFEGDEEQMLLEKRAADPDVPKRIKDDPKAFLRDLNRLVDGYIQEDAPAKKLTQQIAEVRSLLMAEPASSKEASDVYDPVRKVVLQGFQLLESRLSRIQSAVKRPRPAPIGEMNDAAAEAEERVKRVKAAGAGAPGADARPVTFKLGGHDVVSFEDVPRADPTIRRSRRQSGLAPD